MSTDNAPLLERCFLFDAVEDSYAVTGVTGRIPEWLRGTYYVNGPARFQRAGQQYKHWLDGDGMVCAMRFSDEGAHFTNRFVQTQKLQDEEAAGKFLYRGFGTAFPGDRLLRNVMLVPPNNVSVYAYAGTLLAFGEQSLPFELDPVTLETKGEYDFKGNVNIMSPFSAHAKIDPTNGHLLNFGISFSATEPMLNVYEFDAGGDLVRRRRHRLQYQHSVHDFCFSPNYISFYLSPLLMDFQRFWADGISVMESLNWEPEKGARLLVTPRSAKAEAFTLEVSPCYCLHLINSYEEDGRLIIDVLEMDRPIYVEYQPIPDLFPTVSACRPVRFIVDPVTKTIVEKISMKYDTAPDFPAVGAELTGAHYDSFWVLGISATGQPGRKFFDELVGGSWKAGDACDKYVVPRGEYLGCEPVCVINPNDPDDVVVIVLHAIPAEGRTEFLLFDGHALSAGPIARLPLKHMVHAGFHSSFHFA